MSDEPKKLHLTAEDGRVTIPAGTLEPFDAVRITVPMSLETWNVVLPRTVAVTNDGPKTPDTQRSAEIELRNVCEAMAEVVAKMSDEEVIAEVVADGLDPAAEANRIRAKVLGALRDREEREP